MALLRESTEVSTVTPYPINKLDLVKAKMAMAAMQQIKSIVDSTTVTVDQIKAFRQKIAAGSKLKFVQQIMDELDSMIQTHGRAQDTVALGKQYAPQINQLVTSMIDAFTKQDMSAVMKAANTLQPLVDNLDFGIDLPKQAKRTLATNYTVQTQGFFTSSEWGDVADFLTRVQLLDFSKQLYSAVQFPDSGDVNHVAYYLANLKSSPKPFRMNTSGYRLYSKAANSKNEVFKELMALLHQYQTYNDKSAIIKITEMIKKVPELNKAMQKIRASTKYVYRGIDAGDMRDQQIIATDRQNRFVATTPSRSVAANFAHQRGHLEGDTSRAENPRIITYRVTPEAILFDTRILNIAYGETEIVIDTTKATIEEISHEDN